MHTQSDGRRVLRVVSISSVVVSAAAEDVLITYSLGSCIGVTAWDARLRHGGLIHCLLPSAKQGHSGDAPSDAKYVDTGVAALLQALADRGSALGDLQLRIAGGANPLKNAADSMRIGERNVAMLRKLLWKNGLLIAAERIGGAEPRTLSLEIGSGRVFVRTNDNEEEI
jgi:chemotaxis protein CheD